MVKVKPTELKNKISVKASVETNVFSIKDNLSEFYAKQAENWAHSEGMVNGLDYSSKYYAEQSKISAENSQKIGNIIQENYNSFMNLSSSANMELQEVKGEVIDSIGASKQDAIDSIEVSKQDVINDINSTKTTILNDIEFVADGEKQEINALADVIKDNANTVNTAIEAGVERLNSIDALKNNQITNCILEIPQRIKYTLEDGTLTIKAGSVVIVPYGVEDLTAQYPKGATFINDNFKVYDTQFADGKFFVWAELVSGITGGFDVAEQNIKRQVFISLTEAGIGSTLKHISGDNPATTTATWTLAYNTSTNLVGRTNNDTVFNYERIYSLPIMHVVSGAVSDGTVKAYASINQIFNGMGYIGSTVWVDKGVKGLIPNGRNEDGTLRNSEIATTTLRTTTITADAAYNIYLSNGNFYVSKLTAYDEEKNINYGTVNKDFRFVANCGAVTMVKGAISSFNPKQPFRAVDYNDFNDLSNDVVTLQNGVGSANAYLIETYSSGTSWYRIWSNGWCEQGGQTSSTAGSTARTVTLLKAYTNANYSLTLTGMSGGSSGNPHFNVFQCTSISASNFKALAECSEKLILRWSAAWWKA